MHIIFQVCEDVEFWFDDDVIGVNFCPYIEDVCDCNIEISLWWGFRDQASDFVAATSNLTIY